MKPVLFEPLESRTLLSGAMLVKDIIAGTESSVSFYSSNEGSVGNKFLFPAVDETHGMELWASDGTDAGTLMLADINPSGSSSPNTFVTGNGVTYFIANDGSTSQIWETDGTPAGTTRLTSVLDTPLTRRVAFVVLSNNTLYFTEDGDNNTTQLWATDGSGLGAERMVSDFDNATYVGALPLGAANGNLFFHASHGIGSGGQLWFSDGTTLGTRQVKVLEDGHSIGYDGLVFNNQLFFWSFATEGTQLWVSDGTDAGTHQVGTLTFKGNAPREFTVSGGSLYFTANDGPSGFQIYTTDGATLTQVTTFAPDPTGGVSELTDVNGTLFFSRNPTGSTRRLYRLESDGTPIAVPLPATGGGTSISELTAVGSTLFFAAADKNSEYTLFQSDGQSITLVGPDSAVGKNDRGTYPVGLFNVNGTLFYAADTDAAGRELHSATPVANTELKLELGGTIKVKQGDKTPVAFHATLTGATAQRYGWDFTGSGKLRILGANGHSPKFNYSREKPRSIEVRCVVRTTDGRLVEATQFVEIENVAPTVKVTASYAGAVPYLPIAFTATWSDPGFNEKFNVKWTFTDGEVIELAPGTKAHSSKVIKVFTTPSLVHNATCTVTDASGGTGFDAKYVPVAKASVETIRRLYTLFVGGSSSGSTISVSKSTTAPPAPTGMKWVDVVINGLPEGQFLINSAVKIYATANDVIDVEAGTGLIVRIIRSKLQ